jgi:hypothetical protein
MPRRDDDLAEDAEHDPSFTPVQEHVPNVFVTWAELEAALKDWQQRIDARIDARLAHLKPDPDDIESD